MNNQTKRQDDITKVTFEQALTLLTVSWNTRTPMLLVGPPATAKTASAKAFAEYNGFDVIVTTGATSLPTDVKGMPTVIDNKADFIPFGDLRQACNATKPTLWILDDFTNSDKDVQKSFMQLIHERQVGEHVISDEVHIIATGNRREDKSGVSALLEAVKTRFGMVVEILPDVDGYLANYAIPNNLHPDVIGFLRFSPKSLFVHNPSNDMNREPNLRMWKFLSDTLHELDDMQADDTIVNLSIRATCGAATGQNIIDYRSLKSDLHPADYYLSDPEGCDLPADDQIGIIFAVNALLVQHVKTTNIGAIIKIAERLPKILGGKLIFDAKAACPEVITNPDFLAWSNANQSTFNNIA